MQGKGPASLGRNGSAWHGILRRRSRPRPPAAAANVTAVGRPAVDVPLAHEDELADA